MDVIAESPSRWRAVATVLEEFGTYLSERVPRLQLTAACDKNWSDAEYRRLRPRGFPGKLHGVYLIFDDSERLQYVGLATTCFDKRVWTHDRHVQRRFTDIIPIDDAHMFVAPSLEYSLIVRLKPVGNRAFTTHVLPHVIPLVGDDDTVNA